MTAIFSTPPYINVSGNNLYNGPPINPVVGSSTVDLYGNHMIYDGVKWINYSNSYNSGLNHYPYQQYQPYYNMSSTTDIEKIKTHMGMIDPDYNLMDRYPAVKAAYEDYQIEFNKVLSTLFPDLKSAIDSYNIVIALVKTEESDGNNI